MEDSKSLADELEALTVLFKLMTEIGTAPDKVVKVHFELVLVLQGNGHLDIFLNEVLVVDSLVH